VLISIGCWIVFDFLTTATGLYARALLPHLAQPVFAFPELAKVTLPPFALGLFYLAMIATVMSTIDGYGFIAATTIGRDFVWRLRQEHGEERIAHYSKIGLWVAAAFACVLALAEQSVVDLWRDLGSITTPALLLPVGTALLGKGRLNPPWTLAAMVIPFVLSLLWIGSRFVHLPGRPAGYPWAIEPIYAGLGASLTVFAAGWLLKKETAR
jgi:SSS family solute:Na+ symporter